MRFLLALLVMAAAVFGPSSASAQQLLSFSTGELTITSANGEHRFRIELALDDPHREQGLMYRRAMDPDAGMLFVYDHPMEITMWMKNTILPLDMIFIRADGTVLRVAERAVPQSLVVIPSGGPARAILEVNAGTASRLGIKPGDKVSSPAL